MQVVVIADTHLRGGIAPLPLSLRRALESSDLLLHAGDVVSAQAIYELRAAVALQAVLGNNDGELTGILPTELRLFLEGLDVAMVHDSGARRGRSRRLVRRFPGAALVVFGHSHIPLFEEGETGQVLLNPGSPTQRRSQPRPSFARMRIEAGVIATAEIVEL